MKMVTYSVLIEDFFNVFFWIEPTTMVTVYNVTIVTMVTI